MNDNKIAEGQIYFYISSLMFLLSAITISTIEIYLKTFFVSGYLIVALLITATGFYFVGRKIL